MGCLSPIKEASKSKKHINFEKIFFKVAVNDIKSLFTATLFTMCVGSNREFMNIEGYVQKELLVDIFVVFSFDTRILVDERLVQLEDQFQILFVACYCIPENSFKLYIIHMYFLLPQASSAVCLLLGSFEP